MLRFSRCLRRGIVTIFALVEADVGGGNHGSNRVFIHELHLWAATKYDAKIIESADVPLQFHARGEEYRDRHFLFTQGV